MQKQIIAVLFFGTILFAQTRPESPVPASVTVMPISPEGAAYAGIERCQSCHKAEVLQFQKSPHAGLKPAGKNSVSGCEMCHGPGKAHADGEEAARGDDAKTAAAAKLVFSYNGNPKQNAERCMQCHQTSRDQKSFDHSEHMLHGVSCNQCHATHLVVRELNPERTALQSAQQAFFTVPKLAEENRWLHNSLLKQSQPDLCYTCHLNIQAQFALPNHHRVPEGLMKCSDCHNTHGTFNRASLVKNASETCVQCHAEKRGPWVYEHAAVRVEGCVACHTPHGSVNRMLLARREERFMCLQCHVNPFAANIPHSRLSYQERGDCTRCHASIHGSNFNEYLLH